MASTTPSSQSSYATIAFASTAALAIGAIGYAVYFDHRRRTDTTFRKQLKKQHKKVSKASEQEAKASERSQKEHIQRVVDQANEEGFPRDPEETEGYFMQEVARGEGMCTDGSDPVDAALCFYKALKVYPQPRELISIYDKTVPKVSLAELWEEWEKCEYKANFLSQPILDILAEMIAVDPSISVSGSSSDAGHATVE